VLFLVFLWESAQLLECAASDSISLGICPTPRILLQIHAQRGFCRLWRMCCIPRHASRHHPSATLRKVPSERLNFPSSVLTYSRRVTILRVRALPLCYNSLPLPSRFLLTPSSTRLLPRPPPRRHVLCVCCCLPCSPTHCYCYCSHHTVVISRRCTTSVELFPVSVNPVQNVITASSLPFSCSSVMDSSQPKTPDFSLDSSPPNFPYDFHADSSGSPGTGGFEAFNYGSFPGRHSPLLPSIPPYSHLATIQTRLLA